MPIAPEPPASGPLLVCLAGPDVGKRVALPAGPLLAGRAGDANLLSDDPDVSDRFATLTLSGTALRVRALSQSLPFIDGQPVTDAWLGRGQQLRLGRSLWEIRDAAEG